jgi:hypothetical protein
MSLKKPNSKTATIITTYDTDMGLVLNWLRLNKAITAAGDRRDLDGGYAVKVKGKVSKSAIRDLVKDKFGVFAKVI